MNFYNYMLTIQQEVMKLYLKRKTEGRYNIDESSGDVIIVTPDCQSMLRVPQRWFMLDKDMLKKYGMCEMPANTLGCSSLDETQEYVNITPKLQARKFIDPCFSNDPLYAGCKFLGYFKGIKGLNYTRRSTKLGEFLNVTDSNGECLGSTLILRSKNPR